MSERDSLVEFPVVEVADREVFAFDYKAPIHASLLYRTGSGVVAFRLVAVVAAVEIHVHRHTIVRCLHFGTLAKERHVGVVPLVRIGGIYAVFTGLGSECDYLAREVFFGGKFYLVILRLRLRAVILPRSASSRVYPKRCGNLPVKALRQMIGLHL